MSNDHDFRTRVFALHAEGLSNRAIGRALNSNHVTIAKVLAEGAPASPLPAHMQPAHAPLAPPEAPDDAPALQVVRELLSEARRQFAHATAVGNSTEAQRYARTASGLMPVLARLERDERDDDGAIRISRVELEKARASVRARYAALRSRPLQCATCARALSVSMGLGTAESESK
jgi:hypothetical protein